MPQGQLLPVPEGVPLVDAAALPEAACTIQGTVYQMAHLAPGETYLVHGGAGGIGTFAIQIAKAEGCTVACTAGSAEKLARCRELGADLAVSYRDDDFTAAVLDFTGGQGADVILDIMGASYLARNLDALATWGRLVVIATRGGSRGEVDLGLMMQKRATIVAATLRSRTIAEKAQVVRGHPGAHLAAHQRRQGGPGHPRQAADGRGGAGAPAARRRLAHREDPAGQLRNRGKLPPGSRPRAQSLRGRRKTRTMSERNPEGGQGAKVVVVGPDGITVDADGGEGEGEDSRERPVMEMVEQPAKVMRIGSMIRQLLEEVRAAPLDEKSRARLREIHQSSIKELEDGLAPELVDELERLSLPFAEDSVPSEAELRVAQAQLVGWLEGLFHGIQTTLFAQQMAARAQLEQMRRALPPGMMPPGEDAGPAAGGPGLRPLPVGAASLVWRGQPGAAGSRAAVRPGRNAAGTARRPPARTPRRRCRAARGWGRRRAAGNCPGT